MDRGPSGSLLVFALVNRSLVKKDKGISNKAQEPPSDGSSKKKTAKPVSELDKLRKQLEIRESELKEAREEAELTLEQLHQVQEKLEEYFNEGQLRESELKEARESEELTLLQLHQVQQELEHYFLESRDLQKKLDSIHLNDPQQREQLQRIRSRLLKFFLKMLNNAQSGPNNASTRRINALVLRQQRNLRRFQALSSRHQSPERI